MPYQGGSRLPFERASKLGHLQVIKSDLVNQLINCFEDPEPACVKSSAAWEEVPLGGDPLRLIFAVDGSNQTVRSEFKPYKEVSFVKTALLRLDQHAIAKLDPEAPHPMAMRDIMADSAMYHSTVFPLKGVSIQGKNNYDAVRQIVYDSLRDHSLGEEPYKTLKWLAYQKWTSKRQKSLGFQCPHCGNELDGLPFDTDEGPCPVCKGHLFLTDMIGFHLEMAEDSVPESVSNAYMLVYETLLLFTGIRHFWERKKYNTLKKSLFLKDGPLTLRSQYSKLVIPIRAFLEYTKRQGVPIHIAGQEKTGSFVDHLEIINKEVPEGSIFIPNDKYIRREIQHRPDRSEPYGSRTNYGNKVFVKSGNQHYVVLSIPTGDYKDSNSIDDFIGAREIIATLPKIISHRHECALVPIELANGVASLSSYPSAAILKLFADI
ncbi:conserved hypothetical protein [Desulfatibacillum aliphaticivorans]|uniref:NurA domain-containing protein n=1 Tax=Desulfatibacillum aliphaticivorans TaxID=218208 RepID=B8FH19_DESAL|nr:hypothetical protein [Desulfatibacillum aliphaticivorans]ACL02107.1 conserved hypothetical protein [Desulfatibacillum aliphaticivorans]